MGMRTHALIASSLLATTGVGLSSTLVAVAAVQDAPDRTPGTTGSADTERADAPVNASAIAAIENATEAIAESETRGGAAVVAAGRAVSMWSRARAKLAEDGAPAAQLAAASARVASLREALETHADLRRSANDVTGALAPLFAFDGDGTPAEIHTLDYLGRSIVLDVHAADWTRAARDASHLHATWIAVRPRVLQRPAGALAAARYDRMVAAVGMAVRGTNASNAMKAAQRTLDGVDALERTFGA
ncbi:MAG: hypothetical protein NVS2B3_13880 [Vulcanimicrobiaceae bacterium]